MKKRMLTAIGLLMLIDSAAAAERAIWTWEKESYAMVEDSSAADDAIAFLRSKNIRTVYLYADAFEGRNLIESRPELYGQLVRRLHRKGLQAYALLGSWPLHTEEYVLPERRQDALAMFRRVLTYNKSVGLEERFDGVNLDIEPHVLAQWPERKNQLLRQFLDLSQAFMQLKKASGQLLLVGPAMPFWLDGIELEWNGQKKPVSEHVIDTYDYVALMDYRDHAAGGDGIISHAMDEMVYAGRHGRKVVIGTDVAANDLLKVTFNHLTESDMESELTLTEKAFQREPAFAGFAIHHYRAYRNWLDHPKN
jgi:hypothetical protein